MKINDWREHGHKMAKHMTQDSGIFYLGPGVCEFGHVHIVAVFTDGRVHCSHSLGSHDDDMALHYMGSILKLYRDAHHFLVPFTPYADT